MVADVRELISTEYPTKNEADARYTHLEQGKTWEAKKTLAFLRGLGFSKELNLIMRSWLKKQVHAFRIERIADLESMVFKFEPRVQFIPLCKN